MMPLLTLGATTGLTRFCSPKVDVCFAHFVRIVGASQTAVIALL